MKIWMSARGTAQFLNIPYRTVDSWFRDGIITCEWPAGGRGKQRMFNFKDIVLVRLVEELRSEERFTLDMIKVAVALVREKWEGDHPEDAGKIMHASGSVEGLWWFKGATTPNTAVGVRVERGPDQEFLRDLEKAFMDGERLSVVMLPVFELAQEIEAKLQERDRG